MNKEKNKIICNQLREELQEFLNSEYGEQWLVKYQDSDHILKSGKLIVSFVDAYDEEEICFILEYDSYKWEIQIPELVLTDVVQNILNIVKKYEKEYSFVERIQNQKEEIELD